MRQCSHRLFHCLCLFYLGACSYSDQKLVGSWTTHKGPCKTEGEVVVEVYGSKADIDFLCFAKTCARARGKVDQAGYLHFSLRNNQGLEGRIMGDFARGEWTLEMEEGMCSGTFQARQV